MNKKSHESYTVEAMKVLLQLQWFHIVAQRQKTIMKSEQVRIWNNVVGSHVIPSMYHFDIFLYRLRRLFPFSAFWVYYL